MRTFFLILTLFFLVPFSVQAQSKFWIELDGTYWQKYGLQGSFETNYLKHGSLRPWIGMNVGRSWSLGVMGDFTSFRVQEQDVTFLDPIYYPSLGSSDQTEIIGYQKVSNKVARKNSLNVYGLFLRKEVKLTEKMSLDFSLSGQVGSGDDGEFEIYYTPIPCANCSQIASPIRYSIEEKYRKVALDLGWQYALGAKLSLGVRANLLQFTKTTIVSPYDSSGDFTWISYNYNLPFGDREEFGSGITREGLRFLVQFRPF